MKKLLITGLLATFFFINSVSLFALPEDFYGMWIGRFTEDEEIIVIKFQINKSLFTMEIEYMIDDEILEDEDFTVEILGWKETVNTSIDTKGNYPDGYILELDTPFGITLFELFISRDKKQFTIPELNKETDAIMVFVKQ